MQPSLSNKAYEAGEVKSKARSSLKHSQKLTWFISQLWTCGKVSGSLGPPSPRPLSYSLAHTLMLIPFYFYWELSGVLTFLILWENPYWFLSANKYPSFYYFSTFSSTPPLVCWVPLGQVPLLTKWEECCGKRKWHLIHLYGPVTIPELSPQMCLKTKRVFPERNIWRVVMPCYHTPRTLLCEYLCVWGIVHTLTPWNPHNKLWGSPIFTTVFHLKETEVR